jgi:magnesium transporter
MEPQVAVDVSKVIQGKNLARILEQTSHDSAADILQLLPEEDLEQILNNMSNGPVVASLLQYRKDTAGDLMTIDYPVVSETVTTTTALDELRLLGPEAENINSPLVVDDDDRLVGSLSITRLALARPTSVVGELAEHDITSVTAETDQEECVRLMERYNLIELPVVDQEGRLTGVILAEDMVDVVEEEATEDMYRIASVAGERVIGPLRNSLRRRLPWLYINLATEPSHRPFGRFDDKFF